MSDMDEDVDWEELIDQQQSQRPANKAVTESVKTNNHNNPKIVKAKPAINENSKNVNQSVKQNASKQSVDINELANGQDSTSVISTADKNEIKSVNNECAEDQKSDKTGDLVDETEKDLNDQHSVKNEVETENDDSDSGETEVKIKQDDDYHESSDTEVDDGDDDDDNQTTEGDEDSLCEGVRRRSTRKRQRNPRYSVTLGLTAASDDSNSSSTDTKPPTKPSANRGFECDLCGRVLNLHRSLILHKKACLRVQEQTQRDIEDQLASGGDSDSTTERQQMFECRNCGRVLKTKPNLKLHLKSCMKPVEDDVDFDLADADEPGGTITCCFCDVIFKDQSELNEHIIYRHNNIKPYVCEDCESRFSQRAPWQEHVKLEHPFECPKCKEYKYVDEESLNKHIERCSTIAKVKEEITTSLLSVVNSGEEIAECQSDRNAFVPQKVKRERKTRPKVELSAVMDEKVRLKCELDSLGQSSYSEESEKEVDSSSDYEPNVKPKPKRIGRPRNLVQPKPITISGTPKPLIISGTPKPRIISGTPKPRIISGTPKPRIISGTPKPRIISGIPKPRVMETEKKVEGTITNSLLSKASNSGSLSHGCHICKALLPNKSSLRNHIQMFHDYDYLFCCKVCRWGGIDSKLTSPLQHTCHTLQDYAYVTYPTEYRCKICFAVYEFKENYDSHVQEHLNKMLKCDVCGLDCYGLEHRKRHIAQAHGHREVSYTSADGDVKKISVQRVSTEPGGSSADSAAPAPMRRLPINMTCLCTDCNGIFGGFKKLKDHFVSFHLHPNLYFCRHCRRGFSSKPQQDSHTCEDDNLEDRRRKVTMERRCVPCDVAFENKEDFDAHSKMHETRVAPKPAMIRQPILMPERMPCICCECDAIFSVRNSLNRHYAQMHGYTTMHFCFLCSSGYQHGLAFKQHECMKTDIRARLATIPKERICPLCTAGFEVQEQYNDHIREHTKNPVATFPRPYRPRVRTPQKPQKITTEKGAVINSNEIDPKMPVLQNSPQISRLKRDSSDSEPPILSPVGPPSDLNTNMPDLSQSVIQPAILPRIGEDYIFNVRQSNSAVCFECSAIFPSRASLKLHHKNYHGFKMMLFCQVCHSGHDRQTRHGSNCVPISNDELNNKRASILKAQVCTLCHAAFEVKENYDSHCQVHERTKVTCTVCQKIFVDDFVLKKHVERAHKRSKPATNNSNFDISISEANAVISMLGGNEPTQATTSNHTTSTISNNDTSNTNVNPSLSQMTNMTGPRQSVSKPISSQNSFSPKVSAKPKPIYQDYNEYQKNRFDAVPAVKEKEQKDFTNPEVQPSSSAVYNSYEKFQYQPAMENYYQGAYQNFPAADTQSQVSYFPYQPTSDNSYHQSTGFHYTQPTYQHDFTTYQSAYTPAMPQMTSSMTPAMPHMTSSMTPTPAMPQMTSSMTPLPTMPSLVPMATAPSTLWGATPPMGAATYTPTPMHVLNAQNEQKTATGPSMTSSSAMTSPYLGTSIYTPPTSEPLTFFQPFENQELGIASSTQPIPGLQSEPPADQLRTKDMLPSDFLTMFKNKTSPTVSHHSPPRTVKEMLAAKGSKAEKPAVPYKKRAYEFSQEQNYVENVTSAHQIVTSSMSSDVMPSSLLSQFKSSLTNRKRSFEQ